MNNYFCYWFYSSKTGKIGRTISAKIFPISTEILKVVAFCSLLARDNQEASVLAEKFFELTKEYAELYQANNSVVDIAVGNSVQ